MMVNARAIEVAAGQFDSHSHREALSNWLPFNQGYQIQFCRFFPITKGPWTLRTFLGTTTSIRKDLGFSTGLQPIGCSKGVRLFRLSPMLETAIFL